MDTLSIPDLFKLIDQQLSSDISFNLIYSIIQDQETFTPIEADRIIADIQAKHSSTRPLQSCA